MNFRDNEGEGLNWGSDCTGMFKVKGIGGDGMFNIKAGRLPSLPGKQD